MSRRGRKTRNRRPRNRPSTTQPRNQAPTPSTPLRLVLGGPHATPVRPLPARPHTTQLPTPRPPEPEPDHQYAGLSAEVRPYAAEAAIYAGTIPIPTATDDQWTGLTNEQATCRLPDDTGRPIRLVYTPRIPDPRITAYRHCPARFLHEQPVTAPYDLIRLRIATDNCHGHQPLPPAGPRVLPLHDKPREHTHHEP